MAQHRYLITVADQTRSDDGAAPPAVLSFQFENHDDLFQIVERVRSKALFPTEQETRAFCVGLKLLGHVLIQHRKEALFSDFAAAFGTFMKALKSG